MKHPRQLSRFALWLNIARQAYQRWNHRRAVVPAQMGYPDSYQEPKAIEDQLHILRQYFPELGVARLADARQVLPEGAEGWFAIPKWQALGDTYCEALHRVFAALRQSRYVEDLLNQFGPVTDLQLQTTEHTRDAMNYIAAEQDRRTFEGNILMIPCQFGANHAGESDLRVRATLRHDEFALSTFAVACMVLTHPDRFVSDGTLGVHCTGDGFSQITQDHREFHGFCDTPCFFFDRGSDGHDKLWLSSDLVRIPRYHTGAATGFIVE